MFVGNTNGRSTRSTLKTGCTYWTFKADGGVRTAISVARVPVDGAPRTIVMFGDIRANVYARRRADRRAALEDQGRRSRDARASPVRRRYANGRLYVPVSSIEEVPGARAELSVLHLPRQRRRARRGDRQADLEDLHDSGGAEDRRQELRRHADVEARGRGDLDVADASTSAKNMIYVATGNAYTEPAAPTSDAVVALDMTTRRDPVGAAGDAERRRS